MNGDRALSAPAELARTRSEHALAPLGTRGFSACLGGAVFAALND
jgi:hypothetical protein